MAETLEIKEQVKEALNEFFSENNPVLKSLIGSVIEDIAIGKAIEAADNQDFVDEKLIFSELQ